MELIFYFNKLGGYYTKKTHILLFVMIIIIISIIGVVGNSSFKDKDKDGMDDDWETIYGLDNNTDDSAYDYDKDFLTNIEEYENNTDPYEKDTDGDGMDDEFEVRFYLDPLDPADADEDPNGNGLTNLQEYQNGTHPYHHPNPRDDSQEDNNVIPGYTFELLIISLVILFIRYRGCGTK